MSPKGPIPKTAQNKPSKSAINRQEAELKSLKKEQERLTALKIYKPEGFRISDNQSLADLKALIEIKELALLQLKLLL